MKSLYPYKVEYNYVIPANPGSGSGAGPGIQSVVPEHGGVSLVEFVEFLEAPVSSTGQAYQVRHDKIYNEPAKLSVVVGVLFSNNGMVVFKML